MSPCKHGFDHPRILVVEDEGLIATVVATTLTDEGYQVQMAGDGRTAFDLLRSWSPCLILLDIMMPVMDGQVFLEKLWTMQELSVVPVVLISAVHGPMLSDVSIRVADVLRKPFDLDHLVETVAKLVT
jgi:two-component system, chemotaxis family, chemotaxis protein CheY